VGEKSSPNPNMQNPKPADIRPEPDPLPSLAQRLQPNAQTAALVSHSISGRSRNQNLWGQLAEAMRPNHICYSKIALDSSKPVGPCGPTGSTYVRHCTRLEAEMSSESMTILLASGNGNYARDEWRSLRHLLGSCRSEAEQW
jgi:hypothetical protein